MKRYKKICSWMLVLAMIVGLMPSMQLIATKAATVTTVYESEDTAVCVLTKVSTANSRIRTGDLSNASGKAAAVVYPTDYVTYTVSVRTAGTYNVKMCCAANSNPLGSAVAEIPMEVSVGEGEAETYIIANNKNYNSFTEYELSLELEEGTNTITVKNMCEDTTIFVNVDYISVTEEVPDEEITTENPDLYPVAEGRHEAEDAISFTQGSASSEYAISEHANYSGGKAVANMNTWPGDGRAYCTTKVNAVQPGTYSMVIAYSGGEADHPCNIDVRINGGDWISTLAEPTAGWTTVGTIELNVDLVEGVNTIDVTGACNIWYSGMSWEWINVDYFELTKLSEDITTTEPEPYSPTPAVGTVEAEEAEYVGGTISSNPAFSGGKYVEGMNVNVNGDMSLAKYLSYRVIAETAGNYKIHVYYATTSEDTRFGVKTNDDDWIFAHGKSTGSWAVTAVKEVIVKLNEGENTIVITGSLDTGWIIMDKFVMEETTEEPTLDPEEIVFSDEPEEGEIKKTAGELQQENLVSFRGRNMNVEDAVTFDYTGSGFEFTYTGEGSIRANLTTTGNEKFAVDVDGTVTYYSFNSKTGNLFLAEDLLQGTHTIKVYKTQEAMTGLAQLNYLIYDENAVLAPIQTDYNFLIIGASSTCGNQMDPDTGAENGYLAFPSVISRAYNATWQQISVSGRGCTQGTLGESGWTFSQQNQLAEMYTYQSWFRDKTTQFDQTSYIPDVIITNFNNDFSSTALSSGYNVDEIFERMMAFIAGLRDAYPNAYIVMSYGNYPNYDSDGVYSNYQIIEKYKEAVENYKITAEDEKIDFVTFPDLVNGQSGHPNEDEHVYLSELISAKISEFLDVENPLPASHFEIEYGTLNNAGDTGKITQITTWASKFSNNSYVEGMNCGLGDTEIAEDGSNVKYVSVPITVSKDGIYKLELNYATDGTPVVYMRANGEEWQKITLASTGSWATVGQNSVMEVQLNAGENIIDVTGATNGSYVCLDRIDTIFVRNLSSDEPTTDESTTEPSTDEPATDESTTEPSTDEPATDESTTEPSTDEPATDESTTPPSTDEPATDESTTPPSTDEPATDESTTPPSTDEPVTDESTTPPSTDEPATDEPTMGKQTATTPAATTPNLTAPGKAVIKKIMVKKKSAKKVKITVRKVSAAAGYQVAIYKTKKNAKNNKKAVVKKIVTKRKVTVKSKKLKNKEKLFARVRAYKLDTNGKKVYGKWSKVKKVKIKK